MTVIISMLRGVNVGANHRMKMDALRAVYEALGLRDARTYVQSGNVIFKTTQRNLVALAAQIEGAIEQRFGFRAAVILRTIAEMRSVVAANPFGSRIDIPADKLLVTFLASDPGDEARAHVRSLRIAPEELRIEGREIYIYFPGGMGRSKLPFTAIERTLKTPGTGRNWNSVTKMLEMAEQLEASR